MHYAEIDCGVKVAAAAVEIAVVVGETFVNSCRVNHNYQDQRRCVVRVAVAAAKAVALLAVRIDHRMLPNHRHWFLAKLYLFVRSWHLY